MALNTSQAIKRNKTVIAVDVKNLALFSGGIAHFFRPLLRAWIQSRPDTLFYLVGPDFDREFIKDLPNFSWYQVPIVKAAPGIIKHPIYDLVLAPAALKRLNADLFFSPYYDIRFPSKGKNIITVHDLCFTEASAYYSAGMRSYYLGLLKRNLRLADRVLTVSQTSKQKLVHLYNLKPDDIYVVYNSWDDAALRQKEKRSEDAIVNKYELDGYHTFLYPGGLEYRKNIDNLIKSLLLVQTRAKKPIKLLISGDTDERSRRRWSMLRQKLPFPVIFTGFLERDLLMQCYRAVDVVIYLSACEGFGRVCLESMAAGASIVCSDLDVFKEIAGEYPHYCNYKNVEDIAETVLGALDQEAIPTSAHNEYKLSKNIDRFLSAVQMNH